MSRWHFPLILILFLLFSSLSPAAAADAVQELATAFRSATGVVIMPAGEEYLIDLDAAKGLREGDLLTVTVPGEKIVHPVSGEVLGSLDTLKGVLQATRVKSGYSYVRPVGPVEGISRGDTVRRWDQVPAAFKDSSNENLRRELQAALPHLDWRADAKDALLTFVARDGRLEAQGPGGTVLASARLEGAPAASAVTAAPAVAPPPAAIVTAPIVAAPPTPAAAIVRKESPNTQGIWFSPEFSGEAVGVHVADLDGDGRQEVAIAFPYRLEVGRIVDGRYGRIASLDLGYGRKVIALDGADLNGDGRPELYLTAAADGELRSLVAVLQQGKLQVTAANLPWYMRAIHLPGEGTTLLGQRMGSGDRDFDGPLFRLVWRSGAPAEGEPVSVPSGTALFGFLPLPPADGEARFATINPYDELKVVGNDGRTLWKSDERVGGSEAFIERPDPSKDPADGPATRNAFMQARLVPGADGTLLLPVNEGSRLLSRIRTFDKSRIRAMAWNGFALQELWHTQPQSGYLADFRLADADNDGKDELVQAVVFARDGLMSKARSALVIYELP